MNSREKKLLILFLLILTALVGTLFLKSYFEKIVLLETKFTQTKIEAERYERSKEVSFMLSADKEWLDASEPKPQEYSEAMTKFQSSVILSSKNRGLTYDSLSMLEFDDNGEHYRKIQTKLTRVRGTQEQMIQWLCDIHQPSEFRAVTSLSIIPAEKDVEQVIFSLTVDQFLIESSL